MTQEQRRVWLIKELLAERPDRFGCKLPTAEREQRDMLRALMNVREPKPVSPEFCRVQDEYLTEEVRRGGVTECEDLPAFGPDGRICMWLGDITALRVDGIVNAANSGLTGCYQPLHDCVDNIIHTKAGVQLRLVCAEIMRAQGYPEPLGRAKITPAFNLPCGYVLHTVGPIVQGELTEEHRETLRSCYRSCLALAEASGLESVAFCSISTGVFRFPKREAASIAVDTVRAYLAGHDKLKRVVFTVHSQANHAIYRSLLG